MNITRHLLFLDLMCCGFGGAVLMFLIVASAKPESHPTDQLLVVRCREVLSGLGRSEHLARRRAEVGLEYRRVGEPSWQRLSPRENSLERWAFIATSGHASGSETVAVWRQPPQGNWEFRPYLVDFPAANGRPGPVDQRSPSSVSLPVRLDAFARRIQVSGESASRLRLPGETGAVLKVTLY